MFWLLANVLFMLPEIVLERLVALLAAVFSSEEALLRAFQISDSQPEATMR